LIKIESARSPHHNAVINCIYLDTGAQGIWGGEVIARPDAKIMVPKPKN
jgi:hypothetical protein